ncbi:MAG TPA: hypothetical protein PLI21_00400, partial [Methanomassiliicoccaceae archaeon]|nr:hypothetical protein [Methanomassiliicoccaceae archaeon]
AGPSGLNYFLFLFISNAAATMITTAPARPSSGSRSISNPPDDSNESEYSQSIGFPLTMKIRW